MITSDDLFTDEFDDGPLETVQESEDVEIQNAETEEKDEEAKEERNVVQPPKRAMRKPQPKLNDERLKGPKGLSALEKHFERVKYKGKGYEEQDLNVILKTYEYWSHRMFPKFGFDDSIKQIENLGTKRAVQTYVKRIRLGMDTEDLPINENLADDKLSDDNDSGNNDRIANEAEAQRNREFDALFDNLPRVGDSQPQEITDEQLERIRINRERAEKLRKERLLMKAKALAEAAVCGQSSRHIIEESSVNLSNENPEARVSDNNDSSSEEELDTIFEKINSFHNKNAEENSEIATSSTAEEDSEIVIPSTAETDSEILIPPTPIYSAQSPSSVTQHPAEDEPLDDANDQNN